MSDPDSTSELDYKSLDIAFQTLAGSRSWSESIVAGIKAPYRKLVSPLGKSKGRQEEFNKFVFGNMKLRREDQEMLLNAKFEKKFEDANFEKAKFEKVLLDEKDTTEYYQYDNPSNSLYAGSIKYIGKYSKTIITKSNDYYEYNSYVFLDGETRHYIEDIGELYVLKPGEILTDNDTVVMQSYVPPKDISGGKRTTSKKRRIYSKKSKQKRKSINKPKK